IVPSTPAASGPGRAGVSWSAPAGEVATPYSPAVEGRKPVDCVRIPETCTAGPVALRTISATNRYGCDVACTSAARTRYAIPVPTVVHDGSTLNDGQRSQV